MEYGLWFRVSARLEEMPNVFTAACKMNLSRYRKNLLSKSIKTFGPFEMTVGVNGRDFIEDRKTVVFKMQGFKIPRILNPLRRNGRQKYQDHRRGASSFTR